MLKSLLLIISLFFITVHNSFANEKLIVPTIFEYVVKKNDSIYSLNKYYCSYLPKYEKLFHKAKIIIPIPYDKLHSIFVEYIQFINKNISNEVAVEIAANMLWHSYVKRLPPCLVFAIIAHESRFDHTAISHTKDYGLMQISHQNLKRLNLKEDDILNNPSLNIMIGTDILLYHSNRFDRNDWWVTYNIGMRAELIINNVDMGKQYHNRITNEINKIYKFIQKRNKNGS